MKIDLNDPRITAFALGELTGEDAVEMVRAMRSDERVRMAVDEARQTAHLLGGVLSPGGVAMLTQDQRDVIRSAGGSSVIEDIASARVPFWRKPAVAAIGVAAAVAVALYLVGVNKPVSDVPAAGVGSEWNWSQVNTRELTAPVVVDAGVEGSTGDASDAIRAVSAAMSEDTEGFRAEVSRRIESSELVAARELPELRAKEWQDVQISKRVQVPIASGAASWPWVKRYILDAGKLPPGGAVRIEEMVNHFSYREPKMISHGGLVADMELCQTPWNSQTCLLAVNLRAMPGAKIDGMGASLVVISERVKKLRLLGYGDLTGGVGGRDRVVTGVPGLVSQSRGNYVIYELQIDPESADHEGVPMVSLSLGGEDVLESRGLVAWAESSLDMRFASVVAATGMLLTSYPDVGDLDTGRLAGMVGMLEEKNGKHWPPERKEGLVVVRKTLEILGKGTE